MVISAWVREELQTVCLGDKRRETRAKTIVDQLASFAESPPHACGGDHAALTATYRLVNNPAVHPEAILDAHAQASIERTRQHDRVLLIRMA